MYYGCDYYPEHWPETHWAEDARLMEQAGFNVARIGEFAWAKMEPREGHYDWGWLDRAIGILADHDIRVVLGTPTAAPPPWLTTAYPEVLPRDQHRRVRHAGSRRHYCANSPVYREHTRRIVGVLAQRYGHDERILGWQIDNEFGCCGTRLCYCDTCASRFRDWLRTRYGGLDAVNRAWGSVFWSALYSYQSDYYAGRAAATVHELGRGRAIYAGVLAAEDFYGPLFDWLLPHAGVRPLLETPPGVEAVARIGPAGRVLFLLNHNASSQTATLPDRLADAVTGQAVGREVKLGARQVKILHEQRQG